MGYYTNKTLVLAIMALLTAIMFTQGIHNPVQAIEHDGEPEIPKARCIYNGQDYYLTPHIFKDGDKASRIDFPKLPDDYAPEMIIEEGGELTMEFDGDKKPTETQALLVDYDADITETYPLEKVDDDTFEVTQTGIKTLEVIATFPNNEQISYTVLVDVKDNT